MVETSKNIDYIIAAEKARRYSLEKKEKKRFVSPFQTDSGIVNYEVQTESPWY